MYNNMIRYNEIGSGDYYHWVNKPLVRLITELETKKSRCRIFSNQTLFFGEKWADESEDYVNIWAFTKFIRRNINRFIEILVNDGMGIDQFVYDFIDDDRLLLDGFILITNELIYHFNPIIEELKLRCPLYAWSKCDENTREFFAQSKLCNYQV